MKLVTRVLLCALGAAAFVPAARADDGTLDSLRWLAGCWRMEQGDAGSVEVWLPAAGGAMLGMSRIVRGKRLALFEFMQIRSNAAGTLEFLASPSGRPATAFRAVTVSSSEVVFENPAHDFPQRVVHALEGAADAAAHKLRARIEGTQDGRSKTIPFPMVRTTCDGAFAEPKP